MITEECINFFKKIPPFQFLDESDIRMIAGNLTLEFSPRNTLILTQDGPPSEVLRVIKKGGVKVYLSDEDELMIDYKSEGDSFGYLSLITGDKSRANILAVEDTLCYVIPKNIILEIINRAPHFGSYFMKSFFKNYLDRTYSEMQSKNLLFKEGEKLLYTTPVKDIISKSPLSAPEETTIKEAAGIMSRNRTSSVIVMDSSNSPIGIITDRDLRNRVVAGDVDSSRPVKDIMSSGLLTVDAGSTCFDALSVMLRHNIHHLLVTERGELIGVVTNHNFMMLQGTSPLSILKTIDRQQNVDELRSVRDRINKTVSILLKEGVKASNILRIITELHDRLISKIIQLSIHEMGESSCPFAFFVYGAEGRKEETFKTVFRCAIVYDEKTAHCRKSDMEEFCSSLTVHLQDIFRKCDLPLFDIHPLGDEIPIYGCISDWEKHILDALKSGENARTATARKMLDMRAIWGDAAVVDLLQDRLYRQIREKEAYLTALMENFSKEKSPVGFFKKFVVDESGTQQERFDIKQKGASYIIDAVRALSVFQNIHETATMERLNLLSRSGILEKDLQNDISSSFEFLLHLLMQAQLMKKECHDPIDNMIEPGQLTLLEKKTLKEIFHIIPSLQNTVEGVLKGQRAAL